MLFQIKVVKTDLSAWKIVLGQHLANGRHVFLLSSFFSKTKYPKNHIQRRLINLSITKRRF